MSQMELGDQRMMNAPCRKPPTRKPHFFKVLIGDFDRRLRIPHAFLKHISDEKCEKAILRDPRGNRWRVKLRRTAKDLYLQGGWKKFSKAHSLKAGEFLVFRYDGNMRFNVKIFASNACQREDDFALDTCLKDSGSKLRKKRSSGKKLQGFDQTKGLRTPKSRLKNTGAVLSQHSPKCEERSVVLWQSPDQYSQQLDSNQVGLTVPVLEGPEAQWMASEALKAKQAAYSFTSHSPYFVSQMKLSHVQRPFHMTVPCLFARQHLPRESTKMTLLNTQGKEWKVNFHISVNQHMFCGGWNCFSQDNNLKKGDYCLFELVDQLIMRVHIFPVANPSSSSSCPLLMWKDKSD